MLMAMLALSCVFGLVSCQVVARYGPEAQGAVVTTPGNPLAAPAEVSSVSAAMSTADYIRFGVIVQKELGRPHRATSTSPRALDCSQFTHDVFAAFDGRELPRTAAQQFQQGQPVENRALGYGDLVFFRDDAGSIGHVGIALGYGEFIHVSEQNGVIVSALNDAYWGRRFVGARRFIGAPR